ncbi:hypothetical protein N7T26_004773, partial [Salmonella enterica]|nr:hypothetical protein [Salmonella enterica]
DDKFITTDYLQQCLSKLGAAKNEDDITNSKGKSGHNRVRCPEYRWAQ